MIFYFSGTGNSRYIADKLAEKLEDDVVSISECHGTSSFQTKPSEKVGIVSPVYFYGLPSVVEDFISQVKFDQPPSIFLVLTFGSFTAQTGQNAKKLMAGCGFSLDYIFSVKMPENYIPLFSVPDKQRIDTLFHNSEITLEIIAEHLRNGEIGDYDTSKGHLPGLVSFFSRKLYRKGMPTKKFWADDSCNSCGLCVRSCQFGILELRGGKPFWTESRCTRCLSCLHHCPQSAIQLGRFTKNKERYVCHAYGREINGKD